MKIVTCSMINTPMYVGAWRQSWGMIPDFGYNISSSMNHAGNIQLYINTYNATQRETNTLSRVSFFHVFSALVATTRT